MKNDNLKPANDSTGDENNLLGKTPGIAVPAEAPNPQKGPRKLLVVLLITILVLAVAGAVAYFMIFNKSSNDKTATDSLASATKFESPGALVATVEPELSGKVVAVEYSDGVGAVDVNGVGAYSPPPYNVSGKQFASLPVKVEGAGYVGDSITAEMNYKALKEFFKTNKFHEIRSSVDTIGSVSADEESTYISYAEYESSDIVCAIRHVDASATEAKGHISSIGCATKESYKVSANEAQRFYDIYVNGQSDTNEGHVFGPPEITDGADGYKRAVIYQEDASQFGDDEEIKSIYGLYYQEPKSTEWKFFTGFTTDEGLACNEFNSDALKKAFKGLNCFNETTKANTNV